MSSLHSSRAGNLLSNRHKYKNPVLQQHPGERVVIDGDNVRVRWFNYAEAGTLSADLVGENMGYRTSFTVPADAKSGDTIHILAKAVDDGAHDLVHYQRVIITVS